MSQQVPSASADTESVLRGRVEQWRSNLLEIGNRNPLVNCSFSRSRAVEILTPSSETVWRKLAADGEAGSTSMRFPWRRDLVPPLVNADEPAQKPRRPAKGELFPVGDETSELPAESQGESKVSAAAEGKVRRAEWNPSLEECRQSEKLKDSDLLADATDTAIDRQLRTMDGHARLAMSEQGVHSLFIVFGFLKWYESPSSDKALFSPLMLVPVTLSRTSTSAPWELTEAEDDAIDNLCLRQRLWQDFAMELPPLPDINDLEEPGVRAAFLDAVRERIAESDRWEVQDRVTLGLFEFPKVAMWKDLGDHASFVASHPLCRAIAGDTDVSHMNSFGPVNEIIVSTQLDDQVAPGEVKAILDCDSSQLEAIIAARKGVSLVLDGPPGTGKSQTIANIIADALSEGRTVLFVSEKMSALDVVKRRLDEHGLGDFCLACHSTKANRKTVLYELESCLNLPAEVYNDAQPKFDEARQTRNALNDYVRSIHQPREPLGLSPYELYGNVGRLTRLGMATKSRCELPDPAKVDRSTFDGWLGLLTQANDNSNVLQNFESHPWRGCRLTSRSLALNDDLQFHLSGLSQSFQVVADAVKPLYEAGLITIVPIVANTNELMKLLVEHLSAPELPAEWLHHPGESAAGGMQLLTALDAQKSMRTRLAHYVDDVAGKVSVMEVRALIEDEQGWTDQLRIGLPNNVREQVFTLHSLAEKLTLLQTAIDDTQSKLSSLISELQLPIKIDPPVLVISRLIGLAKCIARSGTMRTGWLQAANWTKLRQISDSAGLKLKEADGLQSDLASRIAGPQLSDVARLVGESDQQLSQWEQLQAYVPSGTAESLKGFIDKCTELLKSRASVTSSQQLLWQTLGVSESESANVDLAAQLVQLATGVAESGYLHPEWTDATKCARIRQVCAAAIEDLNDAAQIEESLGNRLSHRAFKSSAGDVAAQSSQFSGRLKRMFGGLGTYKRDAADLYKGSLPGTNDFLADMEQLGKYHRRIQDAQDYGEQLAGLLPPEHDTQSLPAWQQIQQAVDAAETFYSVARNQIIPPESFTKIDRAASVAAAGQVSDALKQFRAELTQASFADEDSLTLDEIAIAISRLRDAATGCHAVILSAAPLFVGLPPTTTELMAVAVNTGRRKQLLDEVSDCFTAHADWMPHHTTFDDQVTWNRISAGVDGAERLSHISRDLSVFTEIFTEPGRLDPAVIAATSSSLESALQGLQKHILDCTEHIKLDLPGEPEEEANRKGLSKLKATATSACTFFQNRATGLLAMLEAVQDESRAIDPESDLDAIDKLQQAIASAESSSAVLAKDGIERVGDISMKSLRWLADASSQNAITPLLRAIVSDPEQRKCVWNSAQKMKTAISGEFKSSWIFLKTLFELNSNVSTGFTILGSGFSDLAEHLDFLLKNLSSLDDWMRYGRWTRDMRDRGFGSVIDELLAHRYEPAETTDVVAVRFYSRLFDHLAGDEHVLGEFDIDQHERIRERFCQLDAWEVKAAATRIRQYQLGRTDRPRTGFATAGSSELGILQREIGKKRKHMPLRKLFAEIPGVLQRLKPCIMMSPLSVSTFLESDKIRFDLVIFDEASQVFPWDAIGAIYRGKQLIVAGDEKQLPPSNFFGRAETENDEENDIGDFESILSLCKSINMPAKRLRWHYRSRREPLIAFSNRHFYDGDLVTFPSTRDAAGDAVRWEYVPEGRWIDRKNIKEAERVADLVIDHFRSRPNKSLGVIAFSQTQMRAIEDTLYDRRRNDPVVDAILNTPLPESLFIKNLENVQGDERDVIILSMAYGFNDAGKFTKSFGPLTTSGGERRLNVAVTRAREEIIFVSSVRAADMDLSGTTSVGSHLLKMYLDYAERGVIALAESRSTFAAEAESPFEEEVLQALMQHGLEPVPQVGCGGFRIDIALKYPGRPGQFCLGIECDGASYHSSHTARDRDRIRQSMLESLGWRIVRVWSTDWVRDPKRQIDSIIDAYQASIAGAPVESVEHTASDLEDDGLEPSIVQAESPQVMTFDSIAEVPEELISTTAARILRQAGSTEFGDLVKLTARELGFQRLGPRIRERIQYQLKRDLDCGKLSQHGDRVHVEVSAIETRRSTRRDAILRVRAVCVILSYHVKMRMTMTLLQNSVKGDGSRQPRSLNGRWAGTNNGLTSACKT